MELRGYKLTQLAEVVHPDARLGERTLRKLYSGESQLTPPILRELAATLDISYAWFTVPDLAHAIHDEDVEGRIAALESALTGLLGQQGPGSRRGPRFVGPTAEDETGEAGHQRPRRRSRAMPR
jgi:hypothetical protein